MFVPVRFHLKHTDITTFPPLSQNVKDLNSILKNSWYIITYMLIYIYIYYYQYVAATHELETSK